MLNSQASIQLTSFSQNPGRNFLHPIFCLIPQRESAIDVEQRIGGQ